MKRRLNLLGWDAVVGIHIAVSDSPPRHTVLVLMEMLLERRWLRDRLSAPNVSFDLMLKRIAYSAEQRLNAYGEKHCPRKVREVCDVTTFIRVIGNYRRVSVSSHTRSVTTP